MTITITIPDIPIIPALLGLAALANLALARRTVAFVWGESFSLIIPVLYDDRLAWIGPFGILFTTAYIWYNIFSDRGFGTVRVPRRR